MSIGLLIFGLFMFIMLVVVHEFGHFIMARRNGVDVEEFGIFFPPRLWKKRMKGGWDFTINLIPLGGFVRMKGEHDSDTEPHSFGSASLGAKTKIMLAGVVMNLLTAFVLLMALAWIGMPKLLPHQYTVKSDTTVVKNEVLVGYVEPHSPAQQAGLKTTDQLLSLTPSHGKTIPVTSASALPAVTKGLAGQKVTITYRDRQQQIIKRQVTFLSKSVVAKSLKSNVPKGYMGISPTQYTLQRSSWSAPITAAGLLAQITALTFKGIGTAIVGLLQGNTAKASSQVSGPVGIFELLRTGSLLGYQFVLMIIAVISLSLAIMNVLPIPALDGGKLFVTLVARGLHKKLTETAEAIIYGTGFAILIVLVILITIVDVNRYF